MAKNKQLKDLSQLSEEDLTANAAGEMVPALSLADAPAQDESENQIDIILKSHDLEGGIIRLNRRGPGENNFAFCARIRANEFDVENVKRIYGGGDYLCQTFRANGQIYKKFEFSVDHRFPGMLSVDKDGKTRDTSDPVAMMRAMSEMTKSDGTQAALMQRMMDSQASSSQQFIVMMQQSSDRQMQMMTTMMTALAGNKPPSDGLSVKDLIVLLPTLLPILRPEQPKPVSMLEMMESMKTMRDLVGTGAVAPAEPEPTTMAEKLLAALPHVATTVQALRGVPAQPPRPVPRPALPGKAPGATTTPPTVTGASAASSPAAGAPVAPVTEEDPKVLMLATLVRAARGNKDPELYADVVLSELTDAEAPMFTQVLTNPDWFNLLIPNLPDAAQLKPWFDSLRAILLEELAPDTNANQPTGQPSSPDPIGLQPAGNADGVTVNP